MIKVLAVGMTGGIGGVETFMTNLYKHLDSKEVQMDFLVHEKIADSYLKTIRNYGNGRIYKITGIKKNFLKYLVDIISFFSHNKYDIIHLNECGASYFIYVFPILFERKTKLIVHSHNGDSAHVFSHKLFRKIQNYRTDAMWACSDVAAQWMFGKSVADNRTYSLIHNGIDLDKYSFSLDIRNRKRKEFGISSHSVVVGSIARFEHQKNHSKIISVFNEYHSVNPDSVLLLVGEGHLKQSIESLVEECNLKECVKFLGIRNDVNEILQAFDVFLLPSLYEGLPFVTVEAQAASLPLVVSNTVSKQIDLTDLVYRVDLEDDDNKWALAISSIVLSSDRNRNDYLILKDKGYDMGDTANIVLKKYESLL
ncbi:glycosyltransferase family 1 protein [Ruminococcus flavefaciens]|uniref:glycosyltransferase family 1 protein n=1 Tax=Ruminococcus flavefaciens TaxID=1265 RepID=UPI000463651E|nr:glycosyltransferase family 1 protein [Ruminococcus flavefaciens]